MHTTRPMLPTLTVNRQFMVDFIAKEPPCLALGLVEAEGSQCAMIALRLNEALPWEVSALGFAFGHAVFGGVGWEVVHFAFEFYGFARDWCKTGGQAAIAVGGNESLAGWNFCPNSAPSVPLQTAHRT